MPFSVSMLCEKLVAEFELLEKSPIVLKQDVDALPNFLWVSNVRVSNVWFSSRNVKKINLGAPFLATLFSFGKRPCEKHTKNILLEQSNERRTLVRSTVVMTSKINCGYDK